MGNNTDKKKVLVVGAGGFTGGFIVDEALRRGHEVWAGVRESTSRKYLSDSRIKFVVLDFDSPDTLAPTLRDALPDGEKWDWIVYNLGATKCVNFADFSKINYDYLRRFTTALQTAEMIPSRFLYMSSLSAMGPGDEKHPVPFTEDMVPMPNTRYGVSKLKAETWLHTAGIPYIIFRATGIYGPRDHDYFLMFESIQKGFDFSVGYKSQSLSFIYVGDLACAIFDALQRARTGEVYNIAEGRAYTQKEFRRLAMKTMGRKFVVSVRMPLWGVKAVSFVAEKIGVARNRPSTLNRDKYKIMKQRNWSVSIAKAMREFGFSPATDLEEGIRRSIDWYRAEGWLK